MGSGSTAKLFVPLDFWAQRNPASGGLGKRQPRRAGIDAVLRVGAARQAARSIGRNRSGQRLIEKKSRGEFGEHRAGRIERSDHDMNVDGPAAVPAGHDGLECHRSIGIRNLIAAHESLRLYFDGFIGIDTCGVSVPNSEYHSR